MQYYIQSVRLGLLSLFYLIMETAFYKGFDIVTLYDKQQNQYYNVNKVLKEDPFIEIWGEDFKTVDDAKKAIDNGAIG